MSRAGCPKCGGTLLRDLELGLEALSTDRVLKCINCGHVPAQRREPTAEERARVHHRPVGYETKPVPAREFAGRGWR